MPAALERVADAAGGSRAELGKAIVGQQRVIREILIAFVAGGHCLLRGVPGLAKTLLIKTLADAVDLKFNRIQFTPDLMPSDIVGAEVIEEDRATGKRVDPLHPRARSSRTSSSPTRSTARRRKTQAALLEAMQEYQVTVGGVRYRARAAVVRARDAEPDRAGRHLSAARGAARSLHVQRRDRLPDGRRGAAHPRRDDGDARRRSSTPSRRGEEIEQLHALVREIPAAENVVDYAARLVRATRPADATARRSSCRKWVRWGAGPRAGPGAAARRARRARCSRAAASPSLDDVAAVALPVLRHRVLRELPGRGRRHRRRRDRHGRLLDATSGPRGESSGHWRVGRSTAIDLDPHAGRIGDLELVARVVEGACRACTAVRSTGTAPSSASTGTTVPATI